MKKVLIVSYFFPPAQSVAGARVFSWATSFKEFGLQPTIITRHWKGDEANWNELTGDQNGEIQYEQLRDYDIYKVPSKKIQVLRIYTKYFPGSKIISKIIYFLINMFGHFNPEADARSSFRLFLFAHLKDHKYDFMIVSSPPLNSIRLAYELKKKFNLPVHVDFRDLWNNGYMNADFKPGFRMRLIDWFKKIYLISWMKSADSASTVSEPIADFLEKTFNRKLWVVTNGFEEDLYLNIHKRHREKFSIFLMGSYYEKQNIDILLKGVLLFIKNKNTNDILISIVGLNINAGVNEKVLSALPQEFIEAKNRVSNREAAQLAIDADVILHVPWQGFKGIYTTKLFDFIASGNNILMAPGDNDVSDNLINKTQTGKIANDEEEVANCLENWFNEWKSTGRIVYHGNKQVINKYRRKQLAEQFAAYLKDIYSIKYS